MSSEIQWIAAGLTVVVVGLYEVWFALALRARPQQVARSVHASLREDWFDAISLDILPHLGLRPPRGGCLLRYA